MNQIRIGPYAVAMFIFDRSLLAVAAGLLTALAIVVAVWILDGGFALLSTS